MSYLPTIVSCITALSAVYKFITEDADFDITLFYIAIVACFTIFAYIVLPE